MKNLNDYYQAVPLNNLGYWSESENRLRYDLTNHGFDSIWTKNDLIDNYFHSFVLANYDDQISPWLKVLFDYMKDEIFYIDHITNKRLIRFKRVPKNLNYRQDYRFCDPFFHFFLAFHTL
jgi:hypothetical protein